MHTARICVLTGTFMKKSKISGVDRKGRNICVPSRYCSSSEDNTTSKMINNKRNNINMDCEIEKMTSSLNYTSPTRTDSVELSAPRTITPSQNNVSYSANIEPPHHYNSTEYSNVLQQSNSQHDLHSHQYTMNSIPAVSDNAQQFPYYHYGSSNNNSQMNGFAKIMLDAIQKVDNAVHAIRDEINNRLDTFEKRMFENVDKLRKDVVKQMIDCNREQPHQSYRAPTGFPLRTLEQLDTFLNNADQIQNLKLYLSSVGGGTVKETINQFVKETLHEELVVHFTWVREGTRTMYNSKLA